MKLLGTLEPGLIAVLIPQEEEVAKPKIHMPDGSKEAAKILADKRKERMSKGLLIVGHDPKEGERSRVGDTVLLNGDVEGNGFVTDLDDNGTVVTKEVFIVYEGMIVLTLPA